MIRVMLVDDQQLIRQGRWWVWHTTQACLKKLVLYNLPAESQPGTAGNGYTGIGGTLQAA